MGLEFHRRARDTAVDPHIRTALGDPEHLGGQTYAVRGREGHLVGAEEDLDRALRRALRRLGLPIGDAQATAIDHAGHAAGLAQEVENEGRLRVLVDLVGRAQLHQLAVLEDRHAVSKVQRFFLVVGDEDRGDPGPVVQLAQPATQFAANLGVQGPERLVQQQHPGLDGERAGERDPLALAAGQL